MKIEIEAMGEDYKGEPSLEAITVDGHRYVREPDLTFREKQLERELAAAKQQLAAVEQQHRRDLSELELKRQWRLNVIKREGDGFTVQEVVALLDDGYTVVIA